MSETPILGRYEDVENFGFSQAEKTKKEKSEKINKVLEGLFSERNELIRDLADGGGSVVKSIIKNFSERIEILIGEDPECQAYKKCLGTMYEKLEMPKKIAKQLEKLFEIEGAPK